MEDNQTLLIILLVLITIIDFLFYMKVCKSWREKLLHITGMMFGVFFTELVIKLLLL